MSSSDSKNSKSNHKRKPFHIHLPTSDEINPVRATKSVGNSEVREENTLNAVGVSRSQENQKWNEVENSKSSRKIQELVKKTSEMKDDLKEKDEFMEEKFNDLRKRINNSVSFLRSTKNQIENIKFLYQNDMLNMMGEKNFGDCLQSSDQSIQELNLQMEEIQKKLNAVRERAKHVKEAHKKIYDNEDFETTVSETVNALSNIGKGDYDEK
ncbi:hypothetical protein ILUMI_12730 [Ignelater luminosus]|uniref:Uncharacterized protein n=1 Tax=Ignelater luminosus TaxID=2038154 RepID=A0A8K0G6I0_IGNLU|nr:hypothetical protein ILUMI_12730 [Ignelater luminosus]